MAQTEFLYVLGWAATTDRSWYAQTGEIFPDGDRRHDKSVTRLRIVIGDYDASANMNFNIDVVSSRGVTQTINVVGGVGGKFSNSGNQLVLTYALPQGPLPGIWHKVKIYGAAGTSQLVAISEIALIYDTGGESRIS